MVMDDRWFEYCFFEWLYLSDCACLKVNTMGELCSYISVDVVLRTHFRDGGVWE